MGGKLGSCLCGGVRFKLYGQLRPVIFCHCSQCLKTHGHFAAYTAVLKEQLEWQNQQSLSWYESSDQARRGFCNNCGASLFFERRNGDTLSIAAGALEKPTGLSASGHIYFAYRSDYYEVLDHLPKFKEDPGKEFRGWKL